MAGLQVGQAYGVFHQPGFGLLVSVPRSLSTQPPFVTEVLMASYFAEFFLILTNLFVAVFVPGYDLLWSYESLLGLYQCDKKFKERVIVHLVYPLSHPPADSELERALKQALSGNRNCHEFIDRLRRSHLSKQNYAIKNVRMPFTQVNICFWIISDLLLHVYVTFSSNFQYLVFLCLHQD